MNCEHVQSNLVEYLLGELDPVTQRKVQEHLSHHCEQCLAELRRLDNGVSILYETMLPDRVDSARVSEIVASVISRERVAGSTAPEANTGIRSKTWQVLVNACCVAAGFFIATALLAPDQPATDIVQHSEMTGPPQLTSGLIAMEVSEPSNGMSIVFLYDSAKRELHFFAERLFDPQAGKSFSITCARGDGEFLVLKKLSTDNEGRFNSIIDLRNITEIEGLYVQTIPDHINEGMTLHQRDNSDIIAYSSLIAR